MNSYRILKTKVGWGLFKAGSVKPLAVALTKEGLMVLAEQFITGKSASVKIQSENGAFQELRF